MNTYLLGIFQPDGERPKPELLEPIMRDVQAVSAEMKSAGVWVFHAGLELANTATVVRVKKNGESSMTDGPFSEGKEHLGGFVIIRCTDLDAALSWGKKLAKATTLPIEVRPVVYAGT